MTAKDTTANVISSLRYRDAPAAIEWLCDVVGFTKRAVYPGKDGGIDHSELAFGNGMVMVSSIRDSGFANHMVQPDEIGGRETQTIYLIVADADAVYEKAKASGADILIEIKDESYGGRGFSCRDPGGHIWSFGTYDPWDVPKQA